MVRLHPYILEIIAQFWEFHKTDGANFYLIFHFANKKILVRQPGRHAKSTNESAFFIGLFFCAHLGMACVPVQRLVVQPHAFSHARLLHKKNYVVLGGQYEGAAVRTMDSPRSDGVLKNRRAEMALPLRLRN